MGITDLMMGLVSDPAPITRFLENVTTTIIRWLHAQLEQLRAPEGILLLDDIVGMVSEDHYREFVAPHLQRIFNEFAGLIRIYHNDTPCAHLYPALTEAGFDVFNFSHKADIAAVKAIMGHRVALMGNVPPLDVGVRAINALLSVGRGQRMGLFDGSGVGKSVLLGMMTRYTNADVIVVGLIGERGREVVEFVQNILGEEGMARAVVVATPADNSPLMRMHGAMLATSIAEYFRDQGLQVLLLMDSLTRFAQAQREIALAIGEPPATKGYPPSVFAKLPQLVERAGNGDVNGGSITAFYTVLAEGDDQNDPIADAARAILDGHIVLSRELAESGHYPAIDIEASISRAMTEITDAAHMQAARRFKQMYSTYRRHRDLISVGAYQKGADPRVDEAVAYHPRLVEFLQQNLREPVPLVDSLDDLDRLVGKSSEAMAKMPQKGMAVRR
jgi:flagellar biosynthesis/type III secretory pathway ATPase